MIIIFKSGLCMLFGIFLLYSRLFKKPLDIPLNPIDNKFLPYLISIFLIVISLSIIFSLTLIFAKKQEKNTFLNKHKRLLQIKDKLFQTYKNNIITRSVEYLRKTLISGYGAIFDWFGPKYTVYLVKSTKYIFSGSHYYKLVIILCELIPRIVILSIFIIEIYYQHLHYYFYSLVLLVIPLIFKFFMFVIEDLGPRVIPELAKLFIFEHENTQITWETTPEDVTLINITLRPEYEHLDLNLVLRDYYFPLTKLSSELQVNFLPLYKKIKVYVLLGYYFIQAIGWGYIIYITFN